MLWRKSNDNNACHLKTLLTRQNRSMTVKTPIRQNNGGKNLQCKSIYDSSSVMNPKINIKKIPFTPQKSTSNKKGKKIIFRDYDSNNQFPKEITKIKSFKKEEIKINTNTKKKLNFGPLKIKNSEPNALYTKCSKSMEFLKKIHPNNLKIV